MTPRSRAQRLRILVAFLTIYLVWGSTFFAIRVAIGGIPPLLMCGARLAIAGALLLGWALAAGDPWPRGREWGNAALVGILLPAFGNGGVTVAETRVASGLVALLVATIPLWMALLAWLPPHRQRPGPLALAGLVVGFAGCGLILRPSGQSSIAWSLLPVAGSLSWAWGSLWSRRVALPAAPRMSTGVGLTAGGVLLLGASAFSGEFGRFELARVGIPAFVALGYLAVVGSVIAFTAYLYLLRTVSPVVVSTYAFVNPVVALALGWAFAGEPLEPRTFVAAGLVVLSVALITLSSRARATAPRAGADGRNA